MNILLVEDETRLADRLCTVLVEESHVVDIAGDGFSGLDCVTANHYDLVILDLMLPGVDGLEICQHMRDAGNQTPVLMLTARGAVEDRVAGLNVGADDYLIKPFAMEELLARVNALLRRAQAGHTANGAGVPTLRVADLTLDLVRHEARRGDRVIELTAKEFALLEYLMRNPGQVSSRADITYHVWRYDLDTLSNVVDIYIHYLREKIDKGFSRPLIKTVRGVGYKIQS